MQEPRRHDSRRWCGIYLMIMSCLLCLGCATAGKSYMDKGAGLTSAGQWDRAVKVYREAIEKHPGDPELKLLLTKAKWNASVDHMEKGERLLGKGHFDEAISEFQMALAFYPGNRKAARLIRKARNIQESLYQARKGKTFFSSGKYAQAREALEKALELDPSNADAKKILEEIKKKARKAPKYFLRVKTKDPISLKFKGTPVANVFEVLSRLTGINFIFDKDVQATRVTLFMTDVTFDHFLDVLLKTSGLAAKVVDPTTVVVYPNVVAKVKEYQDLQIRTFYLNHLSVKRAVALLAKIIKTPDVMGNEKMNSVVIRGSRKQIEIAAKLLEANDRPPAEILLNVEVLEVSRSKEKQLGLEFNPSSITFGIGEAAKAVSSESTFADMASVYALDRLTNKEVLLSLPTATLNLLKQDTDTKTLANPQIRVKSGEKAKIHIGERVPLRVNRRIDTTGVVTNDYQYQDIGIKVSAEPQVNVQDEVTLKLSVEVSALGPNLGTVDEPQFSIKTRMANSTLGVRDGEPVVIGGLISDEERRTIRKVPFLGDIPVLGHLFTNLDTRKVKTDIIMTITPMVLRGQKIPSKDVREIWSGQGRQFSTREPYESVAERKMEYLAEEKVAPKRVVAKKSNASSVKVPTRITEEPKHQMLKGEGPGPKDVPDVGKGAESKKINSKAGPMRDKPAVKSQANLKQVDTSSNAKIKDAWPKMLGYSIHVGSYLAESRAKKRLNELKRDNYDVFMIPAHVPGKGFYYRLFVGKFRDKDSAKMVCDILRAKKQFAKDIHVVKRSWAFGG
ncbi:MAG TPA: tetratricopeptide repeat protein [Desulfobacteraceae bacterium]|nr:tetratricopeptide repeat protein [Deltaproteobacteria bacterium]HDM09036.1 tetratricopeptide repeat protein [Desulfobacteraceae bacterium]